ncbi:hypothetical protein SAICODRAFT_59464 [Saitoella complicata NRRL Y-17804]|nr:uncharacterized protein SAICODRAFT_59464 [Saitoella complicata NRRL Y-17804]ODQ51782.1 hypothetical protein SAICODRAFT_59464 [Saitoella complicata NRRL Y-17804]
MCSGSRLIAIPVDREVLPDNIVPTHYDLHLIPDLEKFTFDGEVAVDLDVQEETTSITLNVLDVKIHKATLSADGSTQESKEVEYDDDQQTATMTFGSAVPAGGKATLKMSFTGELNNLMAGFYRSAYKDAEGKTNYIASTQMEPTDCRRAFPVWDEPSLKATFAVHITAEEHFTVLSNMQEVASKKVDGGKKTVSFATTPKMSTYLLAWVVGDLRYIETHTAGEHGPKIPVRVYTVPGLEEQGRFSLDLGAKTLDFFNKEFGTPYPLPKMDFVAIPDFSAGAMENWGLVTFRTVDLLFEEEKSGAATKQRVAEVVMHELAHQWFGNLVTMDWWNGLWLNEGFATWMSWYSAHHFFPEWKVWETYVTDNLQSALRLDGLRSSHPIEVPVKRADEINQIFDAISYSKGSCVIRMVAQYMGEDVFMQGIRNYLAKHAYGNTRTEDLWEALAAASGKDIVAVADVWTKVQGYPVVNVTEQDGKAAIKVEQHRFLTTGDVKPEEDETLYWIPLGLKTLDKEGKPQVSDKPLLGREQTLEIGEETKGFFKVNTDHAGIYRTAYTPAHLAKLAKSVHEHPSALSVEDRAGLVADAGALAASGYGKTSGLLTLLEQWSSEEKFVVWDEMLGRLGSVRGAWMFEDEKTKAGLKAFTKQLSEPKAKELGWIFTAGEDHVQQQFKTLVFNSAGLAGSKEVVEAAKEMFKKYAEGDKKAIHPNLRGGVFAIVLEEGGEKEWEHIRSVYLDQSNAVDERNTALRALGRTKVPELIQKTVHMSLSPEVKEQDIYLPLTGVRNSAEGVRALWAFAKENWEAITARIPAGLSLLSGVVQIVTSSFTRQEDIDDINRFFKEKSTKGFEMALAQSLDTIKAKDSWLSRDTKDIEDFLKGKKLL